MASRRFGWTNRLVYAGLLFAGMTASARADLKAEKISDTVVDPAGLTIDGVYGLCINGQSFQQDAVITFQGKQYVAYYDADKHVCVARRALPGGGWQVVRLTDYTFKGANADDAHNTISMGICPKDGTIHLAFDHHGEALHYRVSKPGAATQSGGEPWSAELFGPVTSTLEKPVDNITYPAFLQTPDGNLQLLYRFGTSGAGQRWMVDYDGATQTWHRTRQIDTGDGTFKDRFNQSKNRNNYPNGCSYDANGRLHCTWCWRENTQGANHDLCYAYSDDKGLTWKNNTGDVVNPGDGKTVINVDTPGIVVVPIDRSRSLMNQQTQAVDSKGRIHAVMWHAKDGVAFHNKWWVPTESSYFHYWRDDAGKWQRNEVAPEVGNRPKMFFDNDDNAYVVYLVNKDPKNWSHDIYFRDGELRISAATAASGWSDWKVIASDPGPFLNEPLGDTPRLKAGGVLSVFLQNSPTKSREPAAIRVLDFKLSH